MRHRNSGPTRSKNSSLSVSFAVALLIVGAGIIVKAHEGHRHAPASAKALKSPVDAGPANINAGHAAYVQNCAVCHAENGKGDESASSCLAVTPTDLTRKDVQALTDGEIFWEITHGIGPSGMPSFANKISATARWQIVVYVRQLSSATGAGKDDARVDGQYVCPMHRDVVSSSPGKCPKCGMKMVARDAGR